ncbi:MAG: hypothetical protein V4463_02065 [Pseudomonadota bacterium]
MKSLTLRSSVALACALGLSACGGHSGSLLLGGSVAGLTKDGLILLNKNTNEELPVSAGSSQFSFTRLISPDESFEVIVKTQPGGAICTVTNGKGKSGSYSVTSVVVSCTTNTYTLGGTVSGLKNAGLTLVNGASRKDIPADATSFNMNLYNADGTYSIGKVADGAPYGITILAQPAGQTCSLANAIGTMGSADINTVKVTCI